ncbi:MAG: hypothetical protein RSF33_00280 [Hydrogenoanaerobacterium sp.]
MISRLKKQNRGSALVWAVVILLVLSIVITGVLTISLNYVNQSNNRNYERQAYFTARSVATALGDEICKAGEGDSIGKTLLDSLDVGKKLELTDFDFKYDEYNPDKPDPPKMGKCVATVFRPEEDKIEIEATATIGTQSKAVTLLLEHKESAIVFKGVTAQELTSDYGESATLKTSKGADVFVTGDAGFDINCSFTLEGELYSAAGISIYGGSADSGSAFQNIYAVGDIVLVGNNNVKKSVYATGAIDMGGNTPGGEVNANHASIKLPELKEPVFPKEDMEDISGEANPVLGDGEEDKFYEINGDAQFVELTIAEASKNIYIYVQNGANLQIEQMIFNKEAAKTKPNVYVVLEESASLTIGGSEENFCGFIYGKKNSAINFREKAVLYGGVYAPEGEVSFLNLTIESPKNVSPTGGGWEFLHYKKGEAKEVTAP